MKWSEVSDNFYLNGFYEQSPETQKNVRGYFIYTVLKLDLENIPDEFNEHCVFYDSSDKSFSEYKEEKVHISSIIGSSYKIYANCSWIETFSRLNRACTYIIENRVSNMKYFKMLKEHTKNQHAPISLIKTKDNNYYVDNNGNHRVTFYKLLYFSNFYSKKYKSSNYWLYADVREELNEVKINEQK